MNQIERFPLLTHVKCEERDIYLRIDHDSAAQHGSEGVVRVLHLANCANLERVLEELEGAVAYPIWYEVEYETGLVLGLFYGADGVFVDCERWSEREVTVTEADLHVRCRWLARCWEETENQEREIARCYSGLVDALTKELINASGRAYQKEAFFHAHGSERAVIHRAELAVYERIENILNRKR